MRVLDVGTRRRCACVACDWRWTTLEVVIASVASADSTFGQAQDSTRRVWDVARSLGTFTVERVAETLSDIDRKRVHNAIGYLLRRGRLTHLARGQYELRRDGDSGAAPNAADDPGVKTPSA
jgi:hypothetical protein